uniref:Thrombospondin-like N-terminal domain-containing protein n=1 Tax=Periophthalmus magnuspinnatus TaxID=409849 RepID=A0A3B4B7J0_9GOBI
MICLLTWTSFLWTLNSIPCTFGMAVNEQTGIYLSKCLKHNWNIFYIYFFLHSGFDLTETFLQRKGTVWENLPSFRLGSSPLIKPTKSIFPNGLSTEYSLVTTFRVRRTTKKDRWYLWQIFNQSGISQVSVVVDGAKKVVEFSYQSALKNTLRYTFKSRDLHNLFDRQWHKLGITVQSNIVSMYMDCKLVERKLTDEKESIESSGRTLITTRVEDGRPIDVRFLFTNICVLILRCLNGDIFLLIQCEAWETLNGTSPPLVTAQLPQMLSQPPSQPIDRCHCPSEKVQSMPSPRAPN